jgi:hypothetical protein
MAVTISLDALTSSQSVYVVQEGEPPLKHQKTEVDTLSSCPPVEEKDQSFLGYDVTPLMIFVQDLMEKKVKIVQSILREHPDVLVIFSMQHFSTIKESAQAYMAAFEWDEEKRERGCSRLEALYDLYLVNSFYGKRLPETIGQIKTVLTMLKTENLNRKLAKVETLLKTVSRPTNAVLDAIELRDFISQINTLLFSLAEIDAARAFSEPLECEHLKDLLRGDPDGLLFDQLLEFLEKNKDLILSIKQKMQILHEKKSAYEKELRDILSKTALQKETPYAAFIEQFSRSLWEGMSVLLQQFLKEAYKNFEDDASTIEKELSYFLCLNKDHEIDHSLINTLCDEYLFVEVGDLISMAFNQVGKEQVIELEKKLYALQEKDLLLGEDMELDEKKKESQRNPLKNEQLEICKGFFQDLSCFASLKQIREFSIGFISELKS